MCGIFGVIIKKDSNFTKALIKNILNSLFKLSESRGKEAAGLAIKDDKAIYVYKQPVPATKMIRSRGYKTLFSKVFDSKQIKKPLAIIGHSRLVTNGPQTLNDNNQPVIKQGVVGIHNGIITNSDNLWKKFKSMKRKYDIDTEVFLSMTQMFREKSNSLINSVQNSFKNIEGSASIAMLFDNTDNLILATNTGSLYTCENKSKSIFIFASERYILEMLTKKTSIKKILHNSEIKQIKPFFGLVINSKLNIENFEFKDKNTQKLKEKINKYKLKIIDISPKDRILKEDFSNKKIDEKRFLKQFEKFEKAIWKLKRCTKCILPETFPGINFDEKGICNHCKNYEKIKIHGEKELKELVDKFRSKDGKPDCIVAFSGGRDSSYSLHYVKKILKMNPIAYTYDWGMVTDLARRNQARICGKLGIEHIIISADINKKRGNIRKNVLAWLKKPDLGIVPLFMAGDKQYFYYMNKLRKQTGIKLIILGENLLERTEFKTGFYKVKSKQSSKNVYNLTPYNKLKLAAYYGREYLFNLSYLNKSLLDTIGAYASYYIIKHNFVNLYKYIKWEEKKIIPILLKKYNWELSYDTKTTWRIGDGTAAFYNYIYYVLAGFSEFDTFLSNQIREGDIKRAEALKLSKEYNKPRFDSLKWYSGIVGFDLTNALVKINSSPKLYKK